MDVARIFLVSILFCVVSPAILLCAGEYVYGLQLGKLHTCKHLYHTSLLHYLLADGSDDLDVSVVVTYSKPSDFEREKPYYRAGSIVTLTCNVDGIEGPGLSYSWESTCRGSCLASGSNDETITLSALSSSHSGLYTCTATYHENGCTGNATTEVIVAGKSFLLSYIHYA